MSDIVERLRKWFKDVNAVSAIDLMDEAATEIERLRTLATHATPGEGSVHPRLTDEERAAILTAADLMIGSKTSATLRWLLWRTK